MAIQNFSIIGSTFQISADSSSLLHWEGTYDGAKIIAASVIEDHSKCVILLDPTASKARTFENLLCVNRSGRELWRAELPQEGDAFIKFERTEQGLVAHTWGGYYLKLNSKTGKITEKEFVK